MLQVSQCNCASLNVSLCLPAGNRIYISYVYMEYTFNNSVLRTFTKLLQDTVKGRTKLVGGGRIRTGLFESTSIQRDSQCAESASSEENEGMEFTLLLFSLSSVVQTLPYPLLTAVCLALFSDTEEGEEKERLVYTVYTCAYH